METLRELRNRIGHHLDPSLGYDFIRVYLGIGLLIRGAMFVTHPQVLMEWVDTTGRFWMPMLVAHYVAAAHIVGGILLAVGLETRIAAAAQIPVLFGAVFFVHRAEGLLAVGQSLEFAALVLVMLLTYAVFGSGRLSADHWLREKARELEEQTAH